MTPWTGDILSCLFPWEFKLELSQSTELLGTTERMECQPRFKPRLVDLGNLNHRIEVINKMPGTMGSSCVLGYVHEILVIKR